MDEKVIDKVADTVCSIGTTRCELNFNANKETRKYFINYQQNVIKLQEP